MTSNFSKLFFECLKVSLDFNKYIEIHLDGVEGIPRWFWRQENALFHGPKFDICSNSQNFLQYHSFSWLLILKLIGTSKRLKSVFWGSESMSRFYATRSNTSGKYKNHSELDFEVGKCTFSQSNDSRGNICG